MLTKHCWKCGAEYKLGAPGRSETCDCGADLKVCLNCASYDRAVAYQCRDRRADPVEEKHLANYCEYFEFARRKFVKPAEEQARSNNARDQLKKLLGD
jgi:ribosome-binding protein aMBF1 (putative translation factor)